MQNKAEFMAYLENFMQTAALPEEAITCFLQAQEQVYASGTLAEQLFSLKSALFEGAMALDSILKELTKLAASSGINEYTLHFLFLIGCTDVLHEKYREQGISDELFWEAMDDFRCKLLECYEVKGVWGTFVAGWYGGFFNMSRFALGRFQYEQAKFNRFWYRYGDFRLQYGDTVYNFHIPSSGKPFDEAARLDSYKKAYAFFGFAGTGKLMPIVCSSWLLYRRHTEFLPASSNILSFMRDFDIISSWNNKNFNDAWRVFGGQYELPPEQLPTDTSLRRAFAARLRAGKPTGGGYGIILFDGENIVNRPSA